MQCPKCGYKNPETVKYCGACGTQLIKICPECTTQNPPQFNFCGECGTLLQEPAAPSPFIELQKQPHDYENRDERTAPQHQARQADRRQLTVMFCDLVGSTALSQQLDPEELREVFLAYQEVCAKVITRYEGHIAQYLGDGLLVYFGYPLAHEDDARRAVLAGLGIVEAVNGLNTRLGQDGRDPIAVRVGLHTGLVVVGEMGSGDKREHLALGEAPNLSARIQGLAEPNTVVISAKTYRLIEGFFDCRNLGVHPLKGISQPITVYQVLHESIARSRFNATKTTPWTPLVGRKQEADLLIGRWEQVKEGFGHVVELSGEAGIGKSRLVETMKAHVAEDPQASLIECHCSPYHQKSPFYPIIDVLERVVLEIQREDTPQVRLNKLEGFLVQYGFPLPEMVPLFASLLSIPLGDAYTPSTLAPQRQKQKLWQAILTTLLERSARQPMLFVTEDLQWADPTSLELISLLVEQASTAPLLVLVTYRPEFSPPWAPGPHLNHTHITLTRLSHKQTADMAERVADGKTLPKEVLQQIVEKTDGVPLFIEEFTKTLLESDLMSEQNDYYELTGTLPSMAVPTTLRDALMARLDRLSTAKELIQLGATVGREFTFELIQDLSALDEQTLRHELGRLVDTGLLYKRSLPSQTSYIFKHALIQETAYLSLLKSKRARYHQRISQVLVEHFPEQAQAHPELVAHHHTEAGRIAEAISYWLQAGKQAIQRSANLEAIDHLSKGLTLLDALPASASRLEQEIALQLTLGAPLIATKGYASPDVEQAFTHARALCAQVGETPQLFPALRGLYAFYFVRGALETAQELAEQLLSLAQLVQDSTLLVEARMSLGETFLFECITSVGHRLYL